MDTLNSNANLSAVSNGIEGQPLSVGHVEAERFSTGLLVQLGQK